MAVVPAAHYECNFHNSKTLKEALGLDKEQPGGGGGYIGKEIAVQVYQVDASGKCSQVFENQVGNKILILDANGNVIRELENRIDAKGNSMYIIGSDGNAHLNGNYQQPPGYDIWDNNFDSNGEPEFIKDKKTGKKMVNGWYQSNEPNA